MVPPTSRLKTGIHAGTLALIVLLLYWPALFFPYVNYDDTTYHFTGKPLDPGLYATMPVTALTYELERTVFGMNPFVSHLINVLLHMAVTLMVYGLFREALDQWKPGNRWVEASAWAGALLFALHPLRVEPVAWASGRRELLCGLFYAAALWAYLRYSREREGRHGGHRMLGVALVLYVLALGSKFMAGSLPILMWGWDILRKRRTVRECVCEKGWFVGATVLFAGIYVWAYTPGPQSLEQAPILFRLVNAGVVYGFYLQRTIMPLDLVPAYVFYNGTFHLEPADFVAAGAVALALALGLWKGTTPVRVFLVCLTAAFGPVLGVVSLGNIHAADRYTYIPSLLIFLAVSAGLLWLRNWRVMGRGGQMMVASGIGLLAGVLFFISRPQIMIWSDTYALWEHQVKILPQPAIYYSLGENATAAGDHVRAIRYYEGAVGLVPQSPTALFLLALAHYNAGHGAEAAHFAERSLAARPGFARALWLKSFLVASPEESGRLYGEALRNDPTIRTLKRPPAVEQQIRRP
ncbi:MAG: hypothetical protein SFY92_09800 [Verrucomicrobiae bacterium]|nr:hypothetical protein [Verrucomicrobiae bacterium]